MPIQINSPGWRIATPRRSATAAVALPGVPNEFLTSESRVAEEVVLEPAPAARSRGGAGLETLDLSYDVPTGETAILAIRHPSNALTFHLPVQSTSRALRGPTQVRFQVTVRQRATRGVIGHAVKVIVITVATNRHR